MKSGVRARLQEETRCAFREGGPAKGPIGDGPELPLAPGSIFVFEVAKDWDLEWVILAQHPQRPRYFLTVPGDSLFQVGSFDVEVPEDSPCAPLILRCAYGLWLDAEVFASGHRTGRLELCVAGEAERKWSQFQIGASATSEFESETDDDPRYQAWAEGHLAPAQLALTLALGAQRKSRQAVVETLPLGRPPSRFRLVRSSLLTASLMIAASTGLWIQYLGLENLVTRSAMEKKERRQEPLRVVAEESAEGVSRDRMKLSVHPGGLISPAITDLWPAQDERSVERELRVLAGAKQVVLFVPLVEASSTQSYSLELLRKKSRARVWAKSEVNPHPGREIRVGIPTSVLIPGEYILKLSIREADESQTLREYLLRVVKE